MDQLVTLLIMKSDNEIKYDKNLCEIRVVVVQTSKSKFTQFLRSNDDTCDFH